MPVHSLERGWKDLPSGFSDRASFVPVGSSGGRGAGQGARARLVTLRDPGHRFPAASERGEVVCGSGLEGPLPVGQI